MVFTSTSEIGCLCEYFENFKLLGSMTWEKAIYGQSKGIVKDHTEKFGENLYIVGEHNGIGLEHCAISGIYAANQILKSC